MRQHIRGETLQGKAVDQHRDDDHATADAKQTRQHPGEGAQYQIDDEFHAFPEWRRCRGTSLPKVLNGVRSEWHWKSAYSLSSLRARRAYQSMDSEWLASTGLPRRCAPRNDVVLPGQASEYTFEEVLIRFDLPPFISGTLAVD